MEFVDRLLTCADCGGEFIFTAGEQLFFFDKQFKNDPKRCKPCKSKRSGTGLREAGSPAAAGLSRTETRTECSACGIETTVPFKPTQGRPVLCRQCFQAKRPAGEVANAAAATAELMATTTNAEMNQVSAEMMAAAAQAHQA
jgi:CxxC-x17-CxxC domain-containing protein